MKLDVLRWYSRINNFNDEQCHDFLDACIWNKPTRYAILIAKKNLKSFDYKSKDLITKCAPNINEK